MYNLIKAAEDGWKGTIAGSLDYRLVSLLSEPLSQVRAGQLKPEPSACVLAELHL